MKEEKILPRQMAVYIGEDQERETVSIVQYGDEGDQQRHYVEISYDNLETLILRLQQCFRDRGSQTGAA